MEKVLLNRLLLAELAGAYRASAEADAIVADYIRSDEGLHVVTQIVGAAHRYCLYLGQRAPTAGVDVAVDGSVNLDNNFDRRINPHRRDGLKLPIECPPEGFDSMVAINPMARWFSLSANRMVPDGAIVFHELAEALAKVEYGLEYLPDGSRPGAHDIAVEREIKWKSERPDRDAVTTAGPNRVFKSEQGLLKFKAEIRTASPPR